MRRETFNGNYLELYDSIDEMPITSYMNYNRYALIDSGIGSDLDSVVGHTSTIRRYIAKGDEKNARLSLNNLDQNLRFIVSNISPKMNAFAAVIKTLNGKNIDNLDSQEIIRILGDKGLTIGKVKAFLTSLKKKLILKWNCSFLKWRTTP